MANAQQNNCELLNMTQIVEYFAILSTRDDFQRYFLTSCETRFCPARRDTVTRCWPLHGCDPSSQLVSPTLLPSAASETFQHCNSATISIFCAKDGACLGSSINRLVKKCAGQQKNDNINTVNTALGSLITRSKTKSWGPYGPFKRKAAHLDEWLHTFLAASWKAETGTRTGKIWLERFVLQEIANMRLTWFYLTSPKFHANSMFTSASKSSKNKSSCDKEMKSSRSPSFTPPLKAMAIAPQGWAKMATDRIRIGLPYRPRSKLWLLGLGI